MSRSRRLVIVLVVGAVAVYAALQRRKRAAQLLRRSQAAPKRYVALPPLSGIGRALNLIGEMADILLGVRISKVPLKTLVSKAESDNAAATPLFGDQSEAIRALTLFVNEANQQPLHLLGRIVTRGYLERIINARHAVIQYITAHPEVAQQKITKPIIILGLPRTGSTLIYNLLAQDPATRAPYFWEMVQFIDPTPPAPKENWASDPRIKSVNDRFAELNRLCPGYFDEVSKSHVAEAFAPDEELIIMTHQMYFQPVTTVGGQQYIDWMVDPANKRYIYVYLKRFLQMMQSSFAPESHWTLKSPFHALFPDHLLDEFPDARIVVTHRDLRAVVPSFAKLLEAQTQVYFTDLTLDRRRIGDIALRMSHLMTERLHDFRARRCTSVSPSNEVKDPSRTPIHDVDYEELVKNPIQVVKDIYTHFGMTVSAEFEKNMKDYLANHPQGKKGRNAYDMEWYGYSEESLRQTFSQYIRTFPNVFRPNNLARTATWM